MGNKKDVELKDFHNGDIFVYNMPTFGRQAFMLANDKLVNIQSGQILECKDLIYSVMRYYMIEDENEIYIDQHIKIADNEIYQGVYGEERSE